MRAVSTQVDDIMNSFDFDKVLRVMHALNWTWGGETVTMNKLKSISHELLDKVVQEYMRDGKWHASSTGGFEARVDVHAYGVPKLSLAFIVEETTGRYNSF